MEKSSDNGAEDGRHAIAADSLTVTRYRGTERASVDQHSW